MRSWCDPQDATAFRQMIPGSVTVKKRGGGRGGGGRGGGGGWRKTVETTHSRVKNIGSSWQAVASSIFLHLVELVLQGRV